MRKTQCIIKNCNKGGKIVLGLCRRHYYYLIRYGNPVHKVDFKRNSRNKLRHALLDLLGGKCAKCGISDKRVLHIGHKNSDGNKDRKQYGDYQFYKFYLDNPLLARHKLICLCANDNVLMKYEKKEWCNQYTKIYYKSP